eukprot:3247587-Alexandrium_andersonii.AAC.1
MGLKRSIQRWPPGLSSSWTTCSGSIAPNTARPFAKLTVAWSAFRDLRLIKIGTLGVGKAW